MKKNYFVLMLAASVFGIGAYGQGDNCAGAVLVTPGSHVADGPSSGFGGVGDGGNADWYSFVPSCTGTLDLNSCFGGADTRVFLYDGSTGCPVFNSSIASADDDCDMGTGTPFASSLSGIPVTAGTTYYVEWSDFWSTAGFSWNFSINPTGVSGPTSVPSNVSAFIDWNPAGAETDWTIEYGISGFVPGSGTSSNVLVSNTTLIGLNPLTTYEYYITNGSGPCAFAAGPFNFTTLPLCPQPTLTNVTGLTNDQATLNWTAGGMEAMWDVEWDVTGFLLGSGNQDYGMLTNSDALAGLSGSTDYHWYVRAVCDLNVGDGVDTTSYFVGPLSFTTDPTCADPSALNVTGITGFDSDLNWSAGGLETSWNIQWGDAGFTVGGLGSNLINGTSSIPESLTGLTPNSSYEFYVQAVCGSTPDSLSSFVGPFAWNTTIFCVDPFINANTNLTTTSVDANWTAVGTETDWTISYGAPGFTPGSGTEIQTIATTAALTGLTPDTQYCFYVQANCGSTQDSSSNWVGPMCFTTLTACPQPTNLGAINITNTAANLLWQAGGTETMWNVEWGLPGFNPGVGEEDGSVTGTTSNPYYATGLNASNTYEFYVQADCGGLNGTSLWNGPYVFNTIMANDIPCDALNLSVDGVVYTHSNVLASNNGEAAVVPGNGACDDNMSWCGYAQIDQPMWFKFKATASGSAYISTKNSVTTAFNSHTEIAIYSVGLCDNYNSFTLLAANTGSTYMDDGSGFGTYSLTDPGSEAFICSGLIPGEDYYVMVDAFSGDGDNSGGFWAAPFVAFQGTFGVSVDDLPVAVAGTSVGAVLCDQTAGVVDLFTMITGNSSTNGQWYNPTAAPGNELPSSVDFAGAPAGVYDLVYVEGGVCGSDTVTTTMTIETAPSAGADNAITACNTGDVYLIQYLLGFPQMGGTWSDDDASGNLVNGIFQSEGEAAGTFDFTYTVSSLGACPNSTATVTVTLDDCIGLGVVDANGVAQLSVYPNPVTDVLTIQNLTVVGNGVIQIVDVNGRIVSTEQVSDVNGNFELNMKDVARGMYVIRITSEASIQEVRVVKQ